MGKALSGELSCHTGLVFHIVNSQILSCLQLAEARHMYYQSGVVGEGGGNFFQVFCLAMCYYTEQK